MSTNGSKSVWQKTRTQKLIRYAPKGTYYAYFKVGGKPFRKSLETNVYSVAKLRLADEIREQREVADAALNQAAGKLTFADVIQLYRDRVESEPRLKPASRRYRTMTIDFIIKTWPSTLTKRVSKITHRDCIEWLRRFQARFAPSVVNNSIGTLRSIFDEAIERGARFSNPAARLKRIPVRQRPLLLPTRSQFLDFIEAIRKAGAPQSKDCAEFVSFLAYSGLRKSEAKFVTWSDVDFENGEMIVRGDPITVTKNNEVRRVPIIPELREMLVAMRESRAREKPSERVLRVNEAEKSMRAAARRVGISHLRHHDLRHLFASTCIESGVDIPTVSRWLGHKDGGALAMKVYGHLRREHSVAQAKRVRFAEALEPATKVIDLVKAAERAVS
ncbi:MAG TPA: site-specific integrase [Chthoniobacterales bacterium]|nr:site-specific integrase [Chthoniobacterales bacterium]